MTVLEDMGNPVLEHSQVLAVTGTRDIMESDVAESVKTIETLGEE